MSLQGTTGLEVSTVMSGNSKWRFCKIVVVASLDDIGHVRRLSCRLVFLSSLQPSEMSVCPFLHLGIRLTLVYKRVHDRVGYIRMRMKRRGEDLRLTTTSFSKICLEQPLSGHTGFLFAGHARICCLIASPV
jgi:hypothetical protein